MSKIIFINFKSNFSILFSIIKYRKTTGIKNIVGSQTKIDKNEKNPLKKNFLTNFEMVLINILIEEQILKFLF